MPMNTFSILLFLFVTTLFSEALLVRNANILISKSLMRIGRAGNLHMIFGKPQVAKKVTITVDGKVIESSEKTVNLRKELMKNNIDVYPLRAKITGNCGGAGICGTCAVKVLDGASSFNPPSKNEQNTLRGKPADWRLSCCARVSGPITIKTKP